MTELSRLRLEFHPFLLLPYGKQGGLWGRCGAPAPKNPYGHRDPAGVGKRGSRLGSFPRTAKSLQAEPKSLRPQPKSQRLQAWWIPEQAGPGAHGGSGKGLPSPAPSLPSWHSQARRRWWGLGHNVTVAATRGHGDRDRNSRQRPGPGPGGAAGTAQPRGSCNTEKAGNACQARGRKLGMARREGGREGSKTRRDLCAEQPRRRG